MKKKESILFLHNDIRPYRIPLFNELSERLNLDIFIVKEKLSNRKWDIDSNELNSNWFILKYFQIGLIVLNPGLLGKLFKKNYDIFIIAPTRDALVSSLIISIHAKLKQKPLLLFTGEFSTPSTYSSFATLRRVILRKIFRWFLKKFIYKGTDSFIVYSERTKQYLQDLGVEKDKIFSGTQFVPKTNLNFEKDISKPKKYEDKTIVLFLSYFQKRKLGDVLINAFKEINDDTLLIMAGDGPEKENWIKLAKGEKNIIFPGYAQDELKSYLYGISDIFVLPTLWDVWGLVVNEAMMFGLPVIVSKAAGCSSELVENGKNGFIVEPKDIEELKNRLEYLIKNDRIRKKMGKESKLLIEDYNVDMAVETFEKAINQVSNKK